MSFLSIASASFSASLSSKCGFATLLDPHGGRPASAGLGALRKTQRCVVAPGCRLLLLIALALPGLGACQAQPTAALHQAAEDDLLARIRGAIGEAKCSSDAQCRTLAIGEKACGGPQSWLAWSTAGTEPAPLQSLASELAALARHRNQLSGRVSNCQYNADPGAVCQARRCVLRGSAP